MFLLVLYRDGYFVDIDIGGTLYTATNNEIQAAIWKLLFNGNVPSIGGDGIASGGFISWNPILADWLYDYALTHGTLPDYTTYPNLPIVVIIDCGDQVNLLEIPYWLYQELDNLGIVTSCPVSTP